MASKLKSEERERRRLIGSRIRRRRLLLKMTQPKLAKALGITFQQIQKYEKGSENIPQARLREIAYFLDVPPAYFLPEQFRKDELAAAKADIFERFMESPDAVALCGALASLPDDATRRRLVAAVQAFCESHERPEDQHGDLLTSWLARVAGNAVPANHAAQTASALHGLKVEMALLIARIFKSRKWTQKYSGQILNIHQARISAFARGDVRATSLEKLLRHLLMLGWSGEVTMIRRTTEQPATIELTVDTER